MLVYLSLSLCLSASLSLSCNIVFPGEQVQPVRAYGRAHPREGGAGRCDTAVSAGAVPLLQPSRMRPSPGLPRLVPAVQVGPSHFE